MVPFSLHCPTAWTTFAQLLTKTQPIQSNPIQSNPIQSNIHQQIQTVNVKSLGADYELVDGERLPLAAKDLGASDLYPQSLAHNPNGRFVTVCGDGE